MALPLPWCTDLLRPPIVRTLSVGQAVEQLNLGWSVVLGAPRCGAGGQSVHWRAEEPKSLGLGPRPLAQGPWAKALGALSQTVSEALSKDPRLSLRIYPSLYPRISPRIQGSLKAPRLSKALSKAPRPGSPRLGPRPRRAEQYSVSTQSALSGSQAAPSSRCSRIFPRRGKRGTKGKEGGEKRREKREERKKKLHVQ